MYFAESGNFEEALLNSVEASLQERKEKLCDTWDPEAALGSAWGVKGYVKKENIEAVKDFFLNKKDSIITLSNDDKVKILKGDVKEKEDEGILIFRYQLIK